MLINRLIIKVHTSLVWKVKVELLVTHLLEFLFFIVAVLPGELPVNLRDVVLVSYIEESFLVWHVNAVFEVVQVLLMSHSFIADAALHLELTQLFLERVVHLFHVLFTGELLAIIIHACNIFEVVVARLAVLKLAAFALYRLAKNSTTTSTNVVFLLFFRHFVEGRVLHLPKKEDHYEKD